MAENIYYRETSNAQIPFQLMADNAPIDLSEVNKVEIVLVAGNGSGSATKRDTTNHPTKLAITDAVRGKVGFTPAVGVDITYAAGPYKLYFNVYTSASNLYSVPDKDEVTLIVTRGY